ncbi:nuclear pore complex protein NUP58 isoform X2 [Ananas comosus]|uniref:Nuclear pore complex protein NUP58 isoform X2 n=1 Tax=Ananas comosus TaxID=4615 RepID=A0A6P5F9V2_ANACO|nr:nuclear pore complex protein NUP58 isoform X2 [Ananas comosus]
MAAFQSPQLGSPFPSFGQTQPQTQFQFQPQPQPQFQFQPQPQPQPQPQTQFQFQPQQQQQQQPQQQLLLYTNDRAPAGYNTKWEDLHPDSQKVLLQIEERIREYRDESERLDQCSRLYDSSVYNDSFEHDAGRIVQELGGITTAMERERASIQELMNVVNDLMWKTEFAIRSYMMLRPRFIRPYVATPAAAGSATNPIGTNTSGQTNQQMAVGPTYDFYSGVPKRPSPFMQHTVARFEKYLGECCKWIEELEQLVQMDVNRKSANSLEALPKVMSNLHDYFIYVASKVESLHQYIESMKAAYLANQRRRGEGNDPFIEASRREQAKQEVAARRVHPTLHLPTASPQPPAPQSAAWITSNTSTSSSSALQPSPAPSAASLGSGFSTFNTPASSAPSSSFLFSTPTASAPSSTLFASSGFSPQSTPFGSTPSGFGASAPSFALTPAAGGSSLFSTPSLGAVGSGTSFGGASKSSRPKSRTARR